MGCHFSVLVAPSSQSSTQTLVLCPKPDSKAFWIVNVDSREANNPFLGPILQIHPIKDKRGEREHNQ